MEFGMFAQNGQLFSNLKWTCTLRPGVNLSNRGQDVNNEIEYRFIRTNNYCLHVLYKRRQRQFLIQLAK